jgi:hypothetical protein
VIHRSTAEQPEGLASSLYLLSESTYFLVALCLLRECEVPEATLSKIREHQRFQSLAEQLKTWARRRRQSRSAATHSDRVS